MVIFSFECGWLKVREAEWSISLLIPFSTIPYFLSPTTAQPLSAKWTLIWFFLPVSKSISKKLNIADSKGLQSKLLENGVAVLADVHFGVKNLNESEQYIRLSYATSKEQIIKGLDKMKTVFGEKEAEKIQVTAKE